MLICGKDGFSLLDANQTSILSPLFITYLDKVSSVPVIIYTPSIESSASSSPPKAGNQ
jgi:hypothetical protein